MRHLIDLDLLAKTQRNINEYQWTALDQLTPDVTLNDSDDVQTDLSMTQLTQTATYQSSQFTLASSVR
jgi:hypothetical protein